MNAVVQWSSRQVSTLVNLSTVLLGVAQNLIFTGIIARHWPVQALGQWLSLEAGIGLLHILPAVLADLVGFELLRNSNPAERHGLYRLGTKSAFGLSILLLPALLLLPFGHFPLPTSLLLIYGAMRLLGQPVLGTMSKRLYSDGQLSLSFLLGSFDQLLLLAPAAVVAALNGTFAAAIGWAAGLRGFQVLFQSLLLLNLYPWRLGHAVIPAGWSVFEIWRRMLLLTPASLPAHLIQNGITLATAALLGQAELAVFSTHRTAAGFLGQFGNALNEPRLPNVLAQPHPMAAAWQLAWRTTPLLLPLVPVMLLCFPFIYAFWLGAEFPVQLGLFALFLIVQLLRQLQQPMATVIRSRNEPVSAMFEGWMPLLTLFALLILIRPHQAPALVLLLVLAELMLFLVRVLLVRIPAFGLNSI